MSDPVIVFCTTCKGRTQHLAETLPRNITDNSDYANCKFVVLDYGDSGELRKCLSITQGTNIESGKVTVYRHDAPGPFHVSHAKNMAARCGILEGADILVTVDADNFTGIGFASYIAQNFADGPKRPGMFLCPDFPLIQSLPHGPGRPVRGFAGRLAIRAQDFIKMGGYDETFDTWRGEDIDMISRLRRMDYNMRHIDNGFLNAIPHNAEVRFKEYPHARQFENRREIRIIDSRTETVVNFGRFGVGKVFRNYSPRPIDLINIPTRIFGIGMHKTGTTSLDNAFQILGLDSLHWGTGEAPKIWHEMQLGKSKTVEQWYALSDLPIPLLFRNFDAAYPGSKFILTIRDEGAWLKSVERLWNPQYNPTRWMWDVYPISNRLHTALYGQATFDAEVFLNRYRRHNAEVTAYFKQRPDDLLVMDLSAGAGWRELCAFLRLPIPSVPYPMKNRTPGTHRGMAVQSMPETSEVTIEETSFRAWVNSSPCYDPGPNPSEHDSSRPRRNP